VAAFSLDEAFGHLVEGTGASRVEPVRGAPGLSRADFR